MTKVLYTLNASCRHPTQYFAISQSKVPRFDLMSSITSGNYTSPQNRGRNRKEREIGSSTMYSTVHMCQPKYHIIITIAFLNNESSSKSTDKI